MAWFIYTIIFIALFIAEIIYFRIADRFNIIDKPNERSSHTSITLRGGGVIFVLPLLIYFFVSNFSFPWFTVGFLLIAVVSFVDDIKDLPGRIRILIHLAAVSLLFYDAGVFEQAVWVVPIAYILVIGTINAYNFMDGINGITGAYSLVFLLSALAVNNTFGFVANDFIIYPILGVLVFLYFNFRKKAKCFLGDVGSVSMAFLVLFLLTLIIIKTGEYKYILFLGVYGVDSVLTIAHRLLLKENIFKAHRRHLYQYLSNEIKLPHLAVATLYAVLQAIINVGVILIPSISFIQFAGVLLVLGAVYIVAKRMIVTGAIKPVS